MLDLRIIRQDPKRVKKSLQSRNSDVDLEKILGLDEEVRGYRLENEKLRAQRNEIAEKVAEAKRNGSDASVYIEKGAKIAQEIAALTEVLNEKDQKLQGLLEYIPNIPHGSVPVGYDESDNVEVKRWGTVREFGFKPLSHWEIGANLGMVDFERAAKISGARYALLMGDGALLERALVNFMLDVHVKEQGYKEVFPPVVVNDRSMFGTGQLPKFQDDMFKIENQDMYLVPTAEVPVTNIHRDEVLSQDELPVKYTAYTPCFRLEAGSAGKDTRGLIRNHQFNKVESRAG